MSHPDEVRTLLRALYQMEAGLLPDLEKQTLTSAFIIWQMSCLITRLKNCNRPAVPPVKNIRPAASCDF
jgi:hypothetical protein